MCKVIVDNSCDNEMFILYNHLYAREENSFTIKDLSKELKRYNITLDDKTLELEMNNMVKNGIVSRGVDTYKRIAMV